MEGNIMTTPHLVPEPRLKGRFNLYDTPDGGIHISYQEDYKSADEEGNPIDEPVQHLEVPGAILQMAKMLENGEMNPMQVFSRMGNIMGGK
jgi:hypothetical protein